MNSKDLVKLGIVTDAAMAAGMAVVAELAAQGKRAKDMRLILENCVRTPDRFLLDGVVGKLARALSEATFVPRDKPAPWRQWGEEIEDSAKEQMRHAVKLPISVAGALMPDAHVGYGLPIGGVLATENAVIPYAVGVDIACRMRLTVMDLPVSLLDHDRGLRQLTKAIETETRFGVGAEFKDKRTHSVMDEDWSVTPLTHELKNKAWKQLGTSGSGNHFVEFGVFTLEAPELGLQAGKYLALLSHSGSRGAGARICDCYSKRAKALHPDLPKELQNLSWLPMDSADGQEYWAAMNLMGNYASANHACIHQAITNHLAAESLAVVENHHNFAWKEIHQGREVIVHRKGATPAGVGVLGVIPGSMASPAYVVRGLGNAESLDSCSHGAGRVMSRKKANDTLNWKEAMNLLAKQHVTLISASLDEVPFVYKNIENVMKAQEDLVVTIGKFDPRLVKMAPSGERPED
ncbi:MAG: RtcB family protein [Verrucomicrobiota bacterium]|nr:RtcB family protein [Verrucomicrobiota bacterium]